MVGIFDVLSCKKRSEIRSFPSSPEEYDMLWQQDLTQLIANWLATSLITFPYSFLRVSDLHWLVDFALRGV